MISRRKFLKTLAAGAVMGVSPKAYASETETVRIGYLPITDATPLLIAHANRYFHEEGLTVETPKRVRDWSTLAESFLTGKFNVVHLLFPIPVWMRYNNHFPAKVLAWDHINGSAITVRGDSGIDSFADLGGKQIAVPYWYSMHNIILQMGLKKAGLKPVIQPQTAPLKPNQVNLFVLPPAEMPVSLAGKKIDGYTVAEPFNALGELKAGAKILRFTGDIWKNHPCCVIVMNETLTQSQPVFTQKVINAIVRAQLWIRHHSDETAALLSREGKDYLPLSKEVVLRVFKTYSVSLYGKGNTPQAIIHEDWNVSRIGFQPYPYPSATRFIVNEMRHTLMEGSTGFLNRLDADMAVKDLVNDTFVKKAIEAAGGISKFDPVNPDSPWDREEVVEL